MCCNFIKWKLMTKKIKHALIYLPCSQTLLFLRQRMLDSQLGEHLDQSDCAIFIMLARNFWYRKFIYRAHKYRFFSYCYANILGNFTRYYFYNSQSTHWNGILKGKRHFPVYFDLSLRRYAAVAM